MRKKKIKPKPPKKKASSRRTPIIGKPYDKEFYETVLDKLKKGEEIDFYDDAI
jgi:hypothetical protein